MKRFIVLLALAFMAACGSLGLEPPKTFSDRLAYAEGVNTGLREAATDALNHHEITSADMEHVITINTEAKAILLSARLVMNTDLTTAEGKLLAATKLLTDLQTYLRARGVKTSYNLWRPSWKALPLLS